jgi:hypothetical protein
MIGTGLTFAAGVGLIGGLFGLGVVAFTDAVLADIFFIGRLMVAAFLLGVAFSGGLALLARGKAFEKVTYPMVSALGGGAGLLYFLFIGFANGFRVWTPTVMMQNLVLLLLMGTGSAVAMLLVARKARAALASREDTEMLGEGVAPAEHITRSREEVS